MFQYWSKQQKELLLLFLRYTVEKKEKNKIGNNERLGEETS